MLKYMLILAVISRLAIHPWGFTPIGAIGLFVGSKMKLAHALLIPLLAMGLTDALIGYYDLTVMAFVYGGFMLAPLIGKWLLTEKQGFMNVGAAVLTNATVFFLVSNFGVVAAGYYEQNLMGLMESYTLAIPFFGTMLLADGFFSFILFGLWRQVENRSHVPG